MKTIKSLGFEMEVTFSRDDLRKLSRHDFRLVKSDDSPLLYYRAEINYEGKWLELWNAPIDYASDPALCNWGISIWVRDGGPSGYIENFDGLGAVLEESRLVLIWGPSFAP